MKQQKLTRALSIACTIAGLSFSASALGQTSDSATYEATAPAYAVVLDNGLADSSATVTYNNTALDNQSRITDMIAVVEDQDVKVRANSAYSLALVIPTFPYDTNSCQPVFLQNGVDTFGAVGEIEITVDGTTVTFNDLGFSVSAGDNVAAAIVCDNTGGSATITFTSTPPTGTTVDTYTFDVGFLPNGARDDSGQNYGADQEPPAGVYNLPLSATLSTS